MKVLGIDIGGSAFKGAPVDLKTGKLLAERHRVEIDSPCAVADGVDAVRQITKHFNWRGPVGVGFPGIIQNGRIGAVGNLGEVWVGQDGGKLFTRAAGQPVRLVNDADAAGLAEVRFGAGKGRKGTMILLTFGTGIGSALFFNGVLYPNSELGHIPWRGKPFERYAAASVRKKANLDWPEWAERVNTYLAVVERLFAPSAIVLGGGVSKKADKFLPLLKTKAKLMPARLNNDAGIVGAALAWQQPEGR